MPIAIKDVLHYGAGCIMVVVGGLTEFGIHLPGISVMDPEMVIAGGLGILGVGAKADANTNKIGAGLAGALAFAMLAMPAPALAADLSPMLLKAPVHATDCTRLDCTGWIIGANIIGTGSNLDILGSGVNGSVFAGGGLIGVDGGFQFWNGKYFAGALASIDLDANMNGKAQNGRYLAMGLFQAGIGLTGVFASDPTTGPVGIPSQIASALLSPYLQFGVAERARGTAWVSGAGAEFGLSKTWVLRLDYLRLNYAHDTTAVVPLGVVDQSATENLVKATLLRRL